MIQKTKTDRAPAFFIAHGNPMNAIENNEFTKSLQKVGESIQKPKALLAISAHWVSDQNKISRHKSDELIYDMYGFPPPLYDVKYPAKHADFLIPELKELIPSLGLEYRDLDHGVWSVLVHLFPHADVPVIQLAINGSLSMQEHFEMGKALGKLRDEGVMIVGSGNITHNLQAVSFVPNPPIAKWAEEFDDFVKDAIERRDIQALIDFEKNPHAKTAHPSIEHFIPLLYIAGAMHEDDESIFTYEGIEHGSLSMRSWLLK